MIQTGKTIETKKTKCIICIKGTEYWTIKLP